MKKRFIAIVLIATMTLGILGGCGSSEGGSSKKSDTMTVSQMFETVLEENGGELYIYKADDCDLGKDMSVNVWSYNGQRVNACQEVGRTEGNSGAYNLGDIANKKINFEKCEDSNILVHGLDLETDETGNNVYIEAIHTENKRLKFYLGGFSRIEVYDTTFMCFTTNVTDNSYATPYTYQLYYLIEDTETTKDKTIVWDKIGAEGILIDEIGVNKQVYAPATQQPAD